MGIAPFARQLSNNNLKFQTKYGDSKAKFDARPLQLEYYNNQNKERRRRSPTKRGKTKKNEINTRVDPTPTKHLANHHRIGQVVPALSRSGQE